ncbi:beta-aspartyl-peptidase [Clostridium tarantellae]|uniref:Isoaspartyl dipeptidase n=1 Tax=Clostridium tarantellae TaxID=39493 RepID=A0A6I1MKS2_9CLOT|nr:beta-aspartyl-peptidase [Clostridium tarantellae]MPQ43323.1 beta-aspartyl-peptidase [Clostridium tarantellae]
MIKVIKNIEVYSPNFLGKKDIVIIGDKIEGVYDNIIIPENFINIEVLDGSNYIATPGLIDSHVHIIGGGGEGGFKTRTPELQLSSIIKAGITTLVGTIGTDGICRDMKGLIAKAYALCDEGVSCYCYTGSYDVPVKSITESVKSDILLLDKVIGVGEIALSDHRSSQPTYEQFVNVVAQARVGGLLSSKAGIVNVHLGSGRRMMNYLFKLIEETEIPATQILPTHVNRSTELFNMGIEYAKKGGYIDFTTSSNPNYLEEGELRAAKALKLMLEQDVNVENITFSSDGNGSMPLFSEEGKLIGLGICSVESLFREVLVAIEEGVNIESALKVVTSNVADALKLFNKGRIVAGKDADILILDKKTFNIDTVIAKGKILMKNKGLKAKGVFETM